MAPQQRTNLVEFDLASVQAIIDAPDRYGNDREYLEAMCEQFGCQLSRDIIAVTVSSHTDIDRFTADEWDRFSVLFGRVIAQFIAAEEAGYGRPH